MKYALGVVLLVVLELAACDTRRDFHGVGTPPEAGRGGTSSAASGNSAGGAAQSGHPAGGGANDGGANDGGANDGGANDGRANDGGTIDGGANDGGANDGGANDGGANDGGDEMVGSVGSSGAPNSGGANAGAANAGAANAGAANAGGHDVDASSCRSRWTEGALVVDEFSDPCSLEHWDVQYPSALNEPRLLDGLRLELIADAPQPLKRWWGSDNGAYVYQSVSEDGFVVRAEVHVNSNRLDGQPGDGSYQAGGLLLTSQGEFTGDWIFNGVGFINGSSRDCPTDDNALGVTTGSWGVLSEWTLSTGCVQPSQVTRAELAICRYRDRVVAYQRPLAQDAPDGADWTTVHSGSIESLQGELRVGMAISVETHERPELVARFPWISIDTSGIDSFVDCSIENFRARFEAYDGPGHRTTQAR